MHIRVTHHVPKQPATEEPATDSLHRLYALLSLACNTIYNDYSVWGALPNTF